MSNFKVGDVVFVKKSREKVRVLDVRETAIAISGKQTDYLCEYLSARKSPQRFAPAELTRD
jgi:hypothetical protein